jgi:hypothetical protein
MHHIFSDDRNMIDQYTSPSTLTNEYNIVNQAWCMVANNWPSFQFVCVAVIFLTYKCALDFHEQSQTQPCWWIKDWPTNAAKYYSIYNFIRILFIRYKDY